MQLPEIRWSCAGDHPRPPRDLWRCRGRGRDGELFAAAEEERFRRIKHWAGFRSQTIAYCLAEAGIGLKDFDHIAINQDSCNYAVTQSRQARGGSALLAGSFTSARTGFVSQQLSPRL